VYNKIYGIIPHFESGVVHTNFNSLTSIFILTPIVYMDVQDINFYILEINRVEIGGKEMISTNCVSDLGVMSLLTIG
jgi:hypothetical protein